MKITIDKKMLDLYDNVTIGVTSFSLELNEEIKKKIYSYINTTLESLLNNDNINSLIDSFQINKWKQIFSNMNAKKGHESSVVFLSRYLYDNKEIFSIHPIVDLYNIISLKYGIPMGCYDKEKLNDFITLRTAKKGEEFIGINSKQIEKTSGNEIVYADSKGVFCRYWNDKDADRTKLTSKTTDYLLIFDGINDEEIIIKAFNDFYSVLFGDTDSEITILSKNNPTVKL